jgi:tRNA(Phe) wybutosine-synthesizing methylase Tyw3
MGSGRGTWAAISLRGKTASFRCSGIKSTIKLCMAVEIVSERSVDALAIESLATVAVLAVVVVVVGVAVVA